MIYTLSGGQEPVYPRRGRIAGVLVNVIAIVAPALWPLVFWNRMDIPKWKVIYIKPVPPPPPPERKAVPRKAAAPSTTPVSVPKKVEMVKEKPKTTWSVKEDTQQEAMRVLAARAGYFAFADAAGSKLTHFFRASDGEPAPDLAGKSIGDFFAFEIKRPREVPQVGKLRASHDICPSCRVFALFPLTLLAEAMDAAEEFTRQRHKEGNVIVLAFDSGRPEGFSVFDIHPSASGSPGGSR